ncbi:hypothetical protein MMC08_001599 [Hypocenomyce scalaris]|nr:hypothetical protein [Hypocenomyce scalaris]
MAAFQSNDEESQSPPANAGPERAQPTISSEDTDLSGSSSQSHNDTPTPPPAAIFDGYRQLAGWRLVVVEVCLCLGLLLSIVDASIVSTALVSIERYFDDFFEANWVILAYLISYMGFSLLWARLSDIVGRKWTIIAAWFIFAAFSLGGGLAGSIKQLIACRALQGIGGSGLYSLSNVVIPQITPKKHFGTMTGATGTVFAISSVLGPVLGGVISEDSTWRWILLLNVPCAVVAVVTLLVTWQSPGPLSILRWRSTTYGMPVWLTLITHIDFFGGFLLLGSTTLLIFAMQEAGSATYAWSSPQIIGSLSTSGVCFVGLIVWISVCHFKWDKNLNCAIFPVRLVTSRILAATFLSVLLTGFPLFLTIIDLPQRYQIVDDKSSTSAGIRLMPLLFSSAFGSTFGGLCNRRKNTTFYTLTAASCLMLIGCGLLSTAPVNTSIEPSLYGFQVVFGVGLGMTFSTATIIATMESKYADYAIAIGAVNQARILGGAIGYASSTILLNFRLAHDLQGILTPSQLTYLRQNLSEIDDLDPGQQLAVVLSIARSFDDQLRICTYLAAACVVVSLFTFSRHPTDLLKRKELGDALVDGRITLEEADRAIKEK